MLYNNLPSLDLHGIDSDYARILINDFIRDNYNLKNKDPKIYEKNGIVILEYEIEQNLNKNIYNCKEEYDI